MTSKPLAILTPTLPYNFPLLLELIRRHPAPTLNIAAGGVYRRTFAQGEKLALVEVKLTPPLTPPRRQGGESESLFSNTAVSKAVESKLEISLLAQSGEIDETRLVQQVAQVLAVNAPQRAALWNMIQADTRLNPVFASLVGLPMLRADSLFEALINVIIEQQIAWRAAVKGQRWLLEWGGRYLEYEGRRYYAYPTPQQLANATTDDLKPLKITFRRIDLIRQVSNPSLNSLPAGREGATPADTYNALLKIKGIGHWTAAVVTERVHGTTPFIAHNDVGLQAAVGRYFYDRTGKVSEQDVIDTFAPYGEFGGDTSHYTLIRWVFDEYPIVE